MKILVRFKELRLISFKTGSHDVSVNINREQTVLPMVDLVVVRGFGFGLSLSKWL